MWCAPTQRRVPAYCFTSRSKGRILLDITNIGNWLYIILVSMALLTATVAETFASPRPGVTRLLTEHLENPLGIDSREPRLTWQFVQEGRGVRQTAYQVQVADSLRALEAGQANVWDSGKVNSADNSVVLRPPTPLVSGMRYYWRVKVWDADDRSGEFSPPAWFEMGLLHKRDWEGSWIAVPVGGNGYHSALEKTVDATKWVQVDLGEPVEVTRVILHPARPYNWNQDTPGFGFPVRYRIEAANKADFSDSTVLVDRSAEDQPNPGDRAVTLEFDPVRARFVRLVATKLYTRQDGQTLFALAELEVQDASRANVSLARPVKAMDSTEDAGWSTRFLTEGIAHSTVPRTSAPMLRYEFHVSKPVRRARAYVTGLGYYELRLNGRKVGDRVLDPAYTNFGKRVLYSTYDVTDMLRQGTNAVGALIGKGWFSGSPCLMLQLNIDYVDGTHQSVATGDGWKRDWSHITENSLYHGETYDARLEQAGWDKPGFDDSGWETAQIIPSPTEQLSAEMMQPIKVIRAMKPKTLSNPKPGVWVYDFGQNFSGWCRLRVSGPAGTEVKIRHAEILYEDGTVNQENLRSARATDKYILKGQGTETYEPRFTYHGFRYVQVEGFPGTPDLKSIEGRLVHTSFAPHGEFRCADPLVNQIQSNCVWGYRTNFHSIPTDCPQRDERQGWMGDAMVTSDMGFYNFDVAAAYANFLQNISDAQRDDGAVPDTVPHVWGSQPGDPMWAIAYPCIAWDMYRHTGDRRILERHYEGIRRYADMLAREAKDYILERNNYGDWVGVVETPRDLISTGAFYHTAWIVARIAEALGRSDEAARYDALCSRIADAFNARFFDPNTNSYGNGSQYSNIWPLYLGIVPTDKRKAVVENVVRDINENHKGHLSTGFLGTRYILDVLCDEGYADVAWGIVTKRDYPGWGYMIEKGATTIWELWKLETGPGMNSHNHPAYGAVSGWFYRKIAGIMPDSAYPGFGRFDIKPFVPSGLNEARASVETVRGKVSSHWKRSPKGGLTLNVVVPSGSRAAVWMPTLGLADFSISEGTRVVWQAGKFVGAVNGLQDAQEAGDWVRFDVTSGVYSFRLAAR